MALFIWEHALESEFPLAVLEYVTGHDPDPMHWHDYFEIAVVVGGHGSFRFGQAAIPADVGDVFFIDNSQPHAAMGCVDDPLQLLLVLFRPELIAGAGCRQLDLGYLAPFRIDQRVASPRVSGTSPLAAELRPVIEELAATWRHHDVAERHLIDATLRRVLALVNRSRPPDPSGAAVRAVADRREQVRPVLAFVDRHCGESITLDDIAEVMHVSPSRVRHVFKDVTGVGFKDWLTQARVTQAKKLLLGTDLSVAEIAHRVSYSNMNQFYRVFYRTCAMSPGEYRHFYTTSGAHEEPAVIAR